MNPLKYILRPFARFARKITMHLMKDVINEIENEVRKSVEDWTWERYERTQKDIERWTWERYERTQKDIERWTWERYKRTQKDIERWTWERYERTRKDIERWTWERYLRTEKNAREMHRHIDFTYHDMMIAMRLQNDFLPKVEFTLETDYPVAYASLDHIYPHGTANDDTRYPRFVKKCEELLAPKQRLAFLDLGCSGGGMVLEAALRGHFSIGLEGSDYSLKFQRAEWRLIGDRLRTCDISKPFSLYENPHIHGGGVITFDVITMWEVLEHIEEQDLTMLLENVKNHLQPEGVFVASIANFDSIDPASGKNSHVSLHPYEWWKDLFERNGFEVCSDVIEPMDLARGGYNNNNCYKDMSKAVDFQKNFHLVAKKIR